MDVIVGALRGQQEELAGYVAELDEDGMSRESRCPGWSVADVLLHLAQTNEMAVASVEGRLTDLAERAGEMASGIPPGGNVDDWAGAAVDAERGEPAVSRDRWMASAAAQAAAFATCDPQARVRWVAGDMAARSLATTRLSETWIHTVDVAVALGPPPAPTDRLWHVARLVWRTVPYAFAQGGHEPTGAVAFALEAPDGSTWSFGDEADPTVVRGTALALCTVAGQRGIAAEVGLTAEGPDAEAALRLVRTFA